MLWEHPDLDLLDFTYSFFGKPTFTATSIKVSIREFWVLKGFSDYEYDTHYDECSLIYENVISSKRRIAEHTQNGQLKPSYQIVDGPFNPPSESEYFLFDNTTPSYDLNAELGWEIIAQSIRVEEYKPNVLLQSNNPYIDYLDFSNSYFTSINIMPSAIKLDMLNLIVLKGFPGYKDDIRYAKCQLTFENVVEVRRILQEFTKMEEKTPTPYRIINTHNVN